MTCVIIDDNPMARQVLRNMVGEIDFLELVGECEDAPAAANLLLQTPVDLLLLDVEMPRMSGLELLAGLAQKPLVIIISSKSDYALDAFDLEVVDYILKPVQLGRLIRAAERARKLYENQRGDLVQQQHDSLFVRTNTGLVRIRFDDILYLQALGDYVTIQTPQKKYPVHTTMKNIMDHLPPDRFVRTHRSYIVAIDKIEKIEDSAIIFDREAIPVSDSYRAEVWNRLNLI